MPVVPYKPIPDVNPTMGTGARGIQVSTPGAAFGTTVAGAVEAMGGDIAQVGNELNQRAMAFQDLKNRNDATVAVQQFSDQANDLDVDLRNRQGKNAVDRWDTFSPDLEARRQQIRESLPNEEAKRLYDSESRGIYNNINKSGAMWASSQHRVYTRGADDAEISTYQRQMGVLDPTDTKAIDGYKAKIKGVIDRVGNDEGWAPEKTAYETRRSISGGIANQILRLADTEPLKANGMKESVWADLDDQDRDRVTRKMNTILNTVVPKNITADMRSGKDKTLGNRVVSDDRAMDASAAAESGNRAYQEIGPPTKYGRALGRYQVMEAFLPDYLKRAGLPPMSAEAFLASRDAQEAVYRGTFIADMHRYGSFNEAASRWFTGKDMKTAYAQRANDGYHDIDWYLSAANRALARSASEDEVVQAAGDKADSLNLNVPGLRETTELHAVRMHRIDKQGEIEQRQAANNTALAAVTKLRPDGHFITSRDELLQDPEVKEAWTHMSEQEQLGIEKRLTQNAKQGYPYSEGGAKRAQELYGMSISPQGKDTFASMDLNAEQDKYKITNEDINKLVKSQQAIRAHAEETPRISRLLGDPRVRQQMQDMGIGWNQDQARHGEFAATLQDMIDRAQEGKPSAMSIEDQFKVFQDAIKTEAYKSFGGFGPTRTTEPFALQGREANPKLWDELMETDETFRSPTTTDALRREYFNMRRYELSLATKPVAKAE